MSREFFVNQTNPEIFTVIPRSGGIANIPPPEKPKRSQEDGSTSGTRLSKTGMSRSQTGRSSTGKLKSSKVRAGSKSRASAGAMSTTSAGSKSSKKSLLTVSTTYDEPIDLDIDQCPRQYKVKQIIAATPWSVEFDEYLEPKENLKRILDPFQDAVDMLAMSISVIMLLSRGYNTIEDSHFKWVLTYLKCIKDEFGHTPPNIQGILNHINQVTGGKITSFFDDEETEELGEKSTVKISDEPPSVAPEPEVPSDAE